MGYDAFYFLHACFTAVLSTNQLPLCPASLLGSSKGAGLLGEGRVPPLAKYGEDIS